MKIRNQFRLFTIGIIAVPLICALLLPLYHYFTRPERTLIKGYKQIRKLSEQPVSKRDFAVLSDMLKRTPPGVDVLVVANHSNIVFTTMKEFKGSKFVDDATLFSFVKSTSQKYFYQMVTQTLEDASMNVLLVSRVPRDHERRPKGIQWFTRYIIIFITIFELFCILVIMHLSSTISRSITILEDNTQRIADGELDVKLETGSELRTTNEITKLSENLDKMRLALKDASERRQRFIMGISHDLRTPVAVIKGYTEAISDGVISNSEELKKTLDIIGTKTNQLETMIDTLINFVKLNSSDWRSQLQKQKLAPFLKDFAATSISTGGVFKRNVTANIQLDDELEVPFDKQLFQRALENLFSNALRYTQENDAITIEAYKVDNDQLHKEYASANSEELPLPSESKNKTSPNGEARDYGIITIADTGTGIDSKDKTHIFELFYRGTNSRRESGMGIGLSVVKNIIDTHGWQITVQSQKGIGTTFKIIIPLAS